MIVRYRRTKYYLLCTVFFTIIWFLFKLGGIPDFKQAIQSTLIDVACCVISLLISVEYLLPKFVYQRYYSRFIILFLLLTLCAGSAIIFAQLALMGTSIFSYREMIAKYQNHYFYWFWSDLIFGSYFLTAFISSVGCGIRLAFDKIVAEKKAETIGKEKAQAELIILKNQVNPHFMFNALNTIYYKIERTNPSARSLVEQFSSLLRYQLYECDASEVEIEKELKFLADFVYLQKERHNKNLNIVYDPSTSAKSFFIAPFILMPIVENCFKHVSQFTDKENSIKICCSMENDWFTFETFNTYLKNAVGNIGGIGLTNIKKRLALLYPGLHKLDIEEKGDMFKLNLKIKPC